MSSRPGSPALPRPPRTIRQTLVHIVLACVLPAWLGIAVLIFGMYKVLGERTPEGALMTAHALALAVDRELAITQTALESLARSESLTAGDLRAFRDRASRDAKAFALHNVVLIGRTGEQLVNTLLPLGAKAPPSTSAADNDTVFRTGKPLIMNMLKGSVTGSLLVGMKVPVVRNGEVKYVLTGTILPERLNALLALQNLPDGWSASIVDAKRTIVARTHSPGRYVGEQGSPALMEAMARARSGILKASTREGVPVYAAFSQSEASNWAVAIGIPAALVTDRLYEFLSLGAAGGFLVLAAGLGLAGYHAGKIAAGVRSLARDTTELEKLEELCARTSEIREIDEASRRIDAATITLHRRTAERDRAERDKEIAEKAAQLKDEFIATVSHELRTPLTAITASLALMEDDLDPHVGRETKELLDIAHGNSRRLHRLVDDILDIEKLEAGKIAFHLEPVAVQPLLEQALAIDRALAERNGVVLRLVPAQGAAACVHADRDRLAQVVANLLSNAIKFSPRGSEVVLAAEHSDGKVRITVRDHGRGIPAHFTGRVFERFAQADNSDARAKGGTGLGLSIVKEIVQQMGGSVGFADAPGGGTMFFADLPAVEAARAPAASILMCAGTQGAIGIAGERLRRDGYRVDWARSTEDATARAGATAYGLVLVDLQSGELDGISLIRKLRGLPGYADTPLIVLCDASGEARPERDIATLNVFDWIHSPLSAEELRAHIEDALGAGAARPARILHLDDDPVVLAALARACHADEHVVAVKTVAEARAAIAAGDFDLAIVDLDLGGAPGMDILPHLRNRDGRAVPVIIYSTHGATPEQAAQVQAALIKSHTSIANLVRVLRVHIARSRRQRSREREPA
jgi:signal transduction histidine kinase/DNA-binding response OmpR family regulator